MNVQHIGGLFLYSNHPAALAAWYARCFDMTFESYTQPGDTRETYYLEFFSPDERNPGKRVSTVFAIRPAPDSQPLGPRRSECMLNFRLADLDALLAHLTGLGVPIESREEQPYGRFAQIRDGDGNHLELWQPL